MKLKKLLTFVLAIILVFTLCSCGKVTAESLVADMVKAMIDVDSFSGTMDMEMDMSMSLLGETMDMNTSMYLDVEYSDKTAYTNGVYITEMTEADTTTVAIEGYSVTDGDAITAYVLTDGTWYKTTSETVDVGAYLEYIDDILDPENRGSIVLQEELETYNDREVYVLSIADCNYPELALKTVFSQLESLLGDMDTSEIDFSGITMQVTLKVYKDTKLPAQLIIDYGDSMTSLMETVMNAMIESMSGQFASDDMDVSTIFEQLEFSISIPSVVGTICFDEYDIEPIVIPEEALNAEELLTEDNGGLFDDLLIDPGIEDSTTTDDTTALDAPDQVVLYSEDGVECIGLGQIPGVSLLTDYTDDFNVYYEYSSDTEYFSYMYYFVSLDGYAAAELLEDAVPGYEEYLSQFECENVTVSDVQTATIGGYEVTYIVFDYFLEYPSQDVLSIVTYNDSYGIAVETYTMTDGTIDTMATLEAGIEAFVD